MSEAPDVEEAGEAEVRQIMTLPELLQLLDLSTVRFYELKATWDDSGVPVPAGSDESDEPSQLDGPDARVDDEDSASGVEKFSAEFRTAYREKPRGIDYRVEVRVPITGGELSADAAAMYVAREDFSASRELILEFGNMVGAMTVLPYLRQAVMDLSIRVGTEQVVLPIIPRGAVTFGDEEIETPSDGDADTGAEADTAASQAGGAEE